ncbi:hypothetical protein SAMN05421796_1149 [Chryseobacterium piscicola]|uniref:DUF559 domain-containing protein n=1 Tax=Chryseobacterium piscicola TaxID=551459 RepID=A0A1N7PG00_9FLAO|nr:hypothetical protein [Chryseobacterium piscicola]PQA92080.1 hypothetical protein B0A70_11680 [Chryseobacterium piscicola]SIT09450.1 hypothetical protein SAMN05421796_1149 [Chryseobacterium piscicola]
MEIERTGDGRFKKGMSHFLKPAQEIQQMSDAMHDKKYKFLARKSSDNKYGLFECLLHNRTFEQIISIHVNGQTPKNCPECYHKRLSDKQKITNREWIGNRKKHPRYRSDETIRQASIDKFLGRYKYLGRAEDYRYGKFECPHKKILTQVLYQHTKGVHPIGCTKCINEVRVFPRRSDDEIRELGLKQFEGKIYFLGRLKSEDRRHYGNVLCREHGISFQQSITNYIKGVRGCVLCRKESSKFQHAVFKYLKTQFDEDDIKTEKKFEGCKNVYQLRFDFYIKSKNLLIECDGIQHFTSQDYWGGEEGYKVRVFNDQIKNAFTKKNKIHFVRISFYEQHSIEEIMEKIFVQLHTGQRVYRIHDNKLPE